MGPVGPALREIVVVSMLSDNVQYWLQGSIEVLLKMGKKIVLNKVVYMDKELNSQIGLELYYVTGPEHSMHFEPVTPQYKKLKNGTITSLTLKITDQTGKVITDGPGTTVVLHIQ